MDIGLGMVNFKIMKYESRTAEEKKQIEDMIMKKMGKWKYSLDQFAQQIPNAMMKKVQPRWDHAKQTVKDIYE